MKFENAVGEFRSGSGKSVRIGYLNRNRQRCHGHRGVRGNDHLQNAYRVECEKCGLIYGANGSDMHLRKCPKCMAGKKGIPF